MRAVIMAGGKGTRLHPLTERLPKPMARLCGRPVIEYILKLLADHGIRESTLTLQYLPQLIERHFPDGEFAGMPLHFSIETQPLGTAGSVKFAAGAGEEVLVISGDALCDLPLSKAIESHRANGADATIITVQVEDPREYGMVISGADDVITGFVEKPSFTQVTSDLANTGIYILSPKALSLIPNGKQYDFACDLFPNMLEKGMRLQNCTLEGYWCDIGDLDAYRRAQSDLLAGRVKCSLKGTYSRDGNVFACHQPTGDYTINAPVYIGAGVHIGKGVVIGPNTVLDYGCSVAAGTVVRESVLLPDCAVGEHVSVDGAVVCPSVRIQSKVSLEEGCAVGEEAVVGSGSSIHRNMRIAAGVTIPENAVISSHTRSSRALAMQFDDDGFCGEIGTDLTPEVAVRIGCAIGTIADGKTVGIATDDTHSMRVLSKAIVSGISSAGSSVIDFGAVPLPVFSFGLRYNALNFGIYMQITKSGSIRLFGEAGLPIPRKVERQIETVLARSDFKRAKDEQFGEYVAMPGIGVIYTTELLRLAPEGLEGMHAVVQCKNKQLERILGDVLRKLGCNVGGGTLVLQLSSDASNLTLSDPEVKITPHRTVAAYCLSMFRDHKDVAVEHDFPRGIDMLAEQYGQKVYRYFSSPADGSDRTVRTLAATQQAPRDGLMLAVILLSYLKRHNVTLSQLDGQLPVFVVEEQTVDIGIPPVRLLSQFPSEKTGEGILVRNDRGTVFMRSRKQGNAIRVFAEAVNAEVARELCFDFAKQLKETNDTLKKDNNDKN